MGGNLLIPIAMHKAAYNHRKVTASILRLSMYEVLNYLDYHAQMGVLYMKLKSSQKGKDIVLYFI